MRNWTRAGMAAGTCARVGGGGARVAFDIRAALIGVPGELHRFLDGGKVTLDLGQPPAHRSRRMRQWTGQQRAWLVVEYLPPYAPDLNPVETLWANLKGVELANLVRDDLDDVMTTS
jgi:transposase